MEQMINQIMSLAEHSRAIGANSAKRANGALGRIPNADRLQEVCKKEVLEFSG